MASNPLVIPELLVLVFYALNDFVSLRRCLQVNKFWRQHAYDVCDDDRYILTLTKERITKDEGITTTSRYLGKLKHGPMTRHATHPGAAYTTTTTGQYNYGIRVGVWKTYLDEEVRRVFEYRNGGAMAYRCYHDGDDEREPVVTGQTKYVNIGSIIPCSELEDGRRCNGLSTDIYGLCVLHTQEYCAYVKKDLITGGGGVKQCRHRACKSDGFCMRHTMLTN